MAYFNKNLITVEYETVKAFFNFKKRFSVTKTT